MLEVKRHELHRQERWERGNSTGVTRQGDHAAYSGCMRSLVDEMCSIPLTFYREKCWYGVCLQQGQCVSTHISSQSECFIFMYFCTLIWGLFATLHFIWKWEKNGRKHRREAWGAIRSYRYFFQIGILAEPQNTNTTERRCGKQCFFLCNTVLPNKIDETQH